MGAHHQLAAGLLDGLRAATPVMIDDLEALVSVESPSASREAIRNCADAVAALGAKLTGVDPEPIDVGGYRHLRWRLGAAEPRVVLIGHFDTVWPLGTLARWPFSVVDGRATGPGSFDMKAGIVQMFHAVAALSQAEREGVVCLLTSDEELGSLTSRQLVEETAAGARAALILEPSAGRDLKVGRKGTSMYEVRITGRAAHAGNEPQKGANATVELARQIESVVQLARPDLGTTVTPTVAASGTTTNTVPASARLHVDVRCRRRDEQQRVDAAFHALRPAVEGTSLEIVGRPNRPPFDRSSAEPLYQEARQVALALGLADPKAVEVGGGSDGNFTAALGVPTLDGLGAVGAHAHAEGECVLVEAMAERAALLAGLVAAITPASS